MCAISRPSEPIAKAWQRRATSVMLLALVALVAGAPPSISTTLPSEQVIQAWPRTSTHPLVGKILRTSDVRITDGLAVARGILTGHPIAEALEIGGAKFVLLGEVHDNAEHHLLRAGLIDDLTLRNAYGRNAHPPVVTEHIRAEQVPALDEFRAFAAQAPAYQPVTSADLFRALAWDKTGWPSAGLFAPLYDAVISARLPILAGDASRERIRAVARGGTAALLPEEGAGLGLEKPLPAPLADALAAELKGSHCGMLPDSAIPGMALAQRYRDAHLADKLLGAEQVIGTAILLAGNGHVRTDRAVPWYLRARRPNAGIVAVMLIEVEDGREDPAAYVPRDPDGKPAVDAIVFTPRAMRDDPCDKMRGSITPPPKPMKSE